jgi:hypothetical protein
MKNSALVRTLTGRNRTGRTIHAIIDVLPIPTFTKLSRRPFVTTPTQTGKKSG